MVKRQKCGTIVPVPYKGLKFAVTGFHACFLRGKWTDNKEVACVHSKVPHMLTYLFSKVRAETNFLLEVYDTSCRANSYSTQKLRVQWLK
jgi:hypothetical protein